MHPGEIKILVEILHLAEIYQNIRGFVVKYSSKKNQVSVRRDASDRIGGIYVEAFAQSIDSALYSFRSKILELEKLYINNTHLPINYFLKELKEFETLFIYLKNLVTDLNAQSINGCAILGLLHKYSFHTDPKAMQAHTKIHRGVYAIFLRQLSQWLMHGRLVDKAKEFFIVQNDIAKVNSFDGDNEERGIAKLSESVNNKSNSLQFEILYCMIPPNFTITWAEKVLFIGQTILLLNENVERNIKKDSIWSDDDEFFKTSVLWNKYEDLNFKKIQTLYNCHAIDSRLFENVIHEIKLSVTENLSEIACNQADLIKNLKIFKDFFLMGRGELWLEFLSELKNIRTKSGIHEYLARDINQAFQKALRRTFIDADLITMHLQIDKTNDSIETSGDILKMIRLKYNAKWPLHLFFSEVAQTKYNELFNFMLQIRQIQYTLHSVWYIHREKSVYGTSLNSQLRNRMLLLIDNLLYYLQVDVLECQFSIFLNAVQKSKNFEFIQQAHSIFLSNIMSLAFLTDTTKLNSLPNSTNPVLVILSKTFEAIHRFCRFNEFHLGSVSSESDVLLEIAKQ